MTRRVTVVGAGVVGLSCAVRLAEAGVDTHVLARELPAETASATAPGIWLPHLLADPGDRGVWARETLAELRRLADEEDASGVRIRAGLLLGGDGAARPAWDVPGVLTSTTVQDPAPGHPIGRRVELPVVDLPGYLRHLTRRLEAAGGTLTRLALPALPDRGVVVNCTGAAARALAEDPSVTPVRVQSVLLADPGLAQWWYTDPDALRPGAEPLVVVPRGRDVVVGGTARAGDWDPVPGPATAERLVARAVAAIPALAGAAVLGHRVGVQPRRATPRVDVEQRPTDADPQHVRVHCYGHGAHGLALAWGCAAAVVGAVTAAEPAPQFH